MKSLVSTEALQHQEGSIARTIENQTAKIPSDLFLWTGIGCGIASAILLFQDRRRERRIAPLLGELMPTFLLLGIYNKLVKIAGSDRAHGDRGLANGYDHVEQDLQTLR